MSSTPDGRLECWTRVLEYQMKSYRLYAKSAARIVKHEIRLLPSRLSGRSPNKADAYWGVHTENLEKFPTDDSCRQSWVHPQPSLMQPAAGVIQPQRSLPLPPGKCSAAFQYRRLLIPHSLRAKRAFSKSFVMVDFMDGLQREMGGGQVQGIRFGQAPNPYAS